MHTACICDLHCISVELCWSILSNTMLILFLYTVGSGLMFSWFLDSRVWTVFTVNQLMSMLIGLPSSPPSWTSVSIECWNGLLKTSYNVSQVAATPHRAEVNFRITNQSKVLFSSTAQIPGSSNQGVGSLLPLVTD
jgi:hypothetical protein